MQFQRLLNIQRAQIAIDTFECRSRGIDRDYLLLNALESRINRDGSTSEGGKYGLPAFEGRIISEGSTSEGDG